MSLRMRALACVVLLAGGVAMPAPAAAADEAAVRAAIETAIRARLGAAAVVEIDTVQDTLDAEILRQPSHLQGAGNRARAVVCWPTL